MNLLPGMRWIVAKLRESGQRVSLLVRYGEAGFAVAWNGTRYSSDVRPFCQAVNDNQVGN